MEDTVILAEKDMIVRDHLAQPGKPLGAGQENLTLAWDGQRDAPFQSPDLTGLAEIRDAEIILTCDGGPAFRATID